MNESIYAVIAYIARYWFAGLMFIIIWRAIIWLRKDANRMAKVQSQLPDAGYIGEWMVLESDISALQAGSALSAPRDGWIGSARACDVRLKSAKIPSRAARFYFRKDGLHLLPRRSNTVVVDGEPVMREAVLRHGATMVIGGIALQLRLFAGVLLVGEKIMADNPPQMDILDSTKKHDTGNEAYLGALAEERVELPKPALAVKANPNRRRRSGTKRPYN